MGIHNLVGLFFSRSSEYKNALVRHGPAIVDTILLDMNGILHASTKDVDMTNLDAYFNVLSGHLLTIVKQLNPRKNIIFAIDGVAPIAKIDQQRMRRYKASLDRISGAWDSNAITPGTAFMFSIDERIRIWLKDPKVKAVLSKTKEGRPRSIVYSSHLVPGEGEHKLMQWVRDNPQLDDTYVFYGLDADLIVLSLNLPVDHVYLVRERMDNWLNVNTVKKQLLKDMRLADSRQAVQDFTLMLNLIGNDFVPRVLAMNRLDESIPLMLKQYDPSTPLSLDGEIMWDSVKAFMGRMARKEPALLVLVANEQHDNPYHAFEGSGGRLRHDNRDNNSRDNHRDDDDDDPFHQRIMATYYRHVFSLKGLNQFPRDMRDMLSQRYAVDIDEQINEMCSKWFAGMGWVFNYYTRGDANPEFLYPFKYAPFLKSSHQWLVRGNSVNSAAYLPVADKPFIMFSPLQQMLAVLPPRSVDILPQLLKPLMNNISFIDMFPESVYVELEGTSESTKWHAKALVPPIDPARIILATSTLDMPQKQLAKYAKQTSLSMLCTQADIDFANNSKQFAAAARDFASKKWVQSPDAWRNPSFLEA